MNIPRFSVRHQTVVWILVLLLTAWGALNYVTISRREDPEIEISVALVITIWPGASAEQVERLVTNELEETIETIGTLKELTSTSRDNLSVIFVSVDFDSDVDMGWQILRNKVAEARADLPSGVIGPDVMDDFGDVTAMIWSLSSPTAEPRELERWAEELKAELQRLDSVGKVELVGVQEEAIYIEGPLESFTTYRFSQLAAARILDAINVNLPSGHVRTPTRNYRLDTSGSFSVLDDLREAVLDVSRETGHPLKVRDVFTVRRAYAEPPLDTMWTNGAPSVGLDVRMKAGRNIVEMGREVKALAEAFRPRLPADVALTLVHDQPREVDDFIGTFLDNLWEGLAIVVFVMLVAMGFRSTLIVAVSLPLSIIFTFAVMPSFDVALETVSIGSFIIALGMLVDNAIIISDNVYRHIEEGVPPERAAVDGAHELVLPVLSGTLATAVAFLPLLLMKDETGAYIRSLPIVVTVSLVASLVLAVTITPILAARVLRPKKHRRPRLPLRERLGRRIYGAFMRVGMKLRHVVILASVAALVGAGALMEEVGFSFFPESDRDQFTVDIWLPEGSALTETTRVAREVEEILRQQEEVTSFVSYVGKGGPRFFISITPEFNTSNYAQIMVNTRRKDETRALVARLDHRIRAEVPGARIRVANLLTGIPVEAPIALRLTGPDLHVMKDLSERIQAVLRAQAGASAVRDNLGEETISLGIEVDSENALMFGLTNTEIAASLLTAFEGLPVTEFRAQGEKIPVYLRLNEEERTAGDALHLLAVPSQATGAKVPLAAFARATPRWSPGIVKHFDGRRSVTVLSDLCCGALADDVLRAALPAIGEIPLPPGYGLDMGGEKEERDKAFGELLVIFALILGGLLLMLTIQFNGLKRALAILVTVPLAFIGAVLGLWFSRNSFGFMAFLGVISLAGMVIKNAVVWVEFVDQSLAAGGTLADAIIDAGIVRLRPILLTALTTIGGLFPLALFGGVLWEGMAWAMIFGLALATVLTLIINPIIFYAIFRRTYRDREQPPAQPEPPPAAEEGSEPAPAPAPAA